MNEAQREAMAERENTPSYLIYALFACHIAMSLQWMYFWWVDLSQARVRLLLWLVPAMALLTLPAYQWYKRRTNSQHPWWLTAIVVAAIYIASQELLPWVQTLTHHGRVVPEFFLHIAWCALLMGPAIAWTLMHRKQQSHKMAASAYHIGTWLGWFVLWSGFLQRADNGCTGTSQAYGWTLFTTATILIVWAILMLLINTIQNAPKTVTKAQ